VPAAGDEGQVACPAGPRFWEGAGLASNRPGRRLLRQELRMASPTHATLATIRMDLSREAEQREGLQREPTPRRVGPGGCAHSRGGRQRVEAPESSAPVAGVWWRGPAGRISADMGHPLDHLWGGAAARVNCAGDA
jgi:hypothetical protein